METVDEVLEHFGVLGMHWGVRRGNTSTGSSKGASSSPVTSGGGSKSSESKTKYSKSQIEEEAAFLSTHTVITNIPPKVDSFTIDNHGKLAVVINVEKGSEADHAHAVSSLKRPLYPYEKVVNITTMNEEQALASKAHFDAIEKKKDNAAKTRGSGKSSDVRTAYRIAQRALRFVARQSDEETVDDILEHFGIRGMHWGVRKDRTTRVKVGEELKTIKVPHNTSTDAMKAHNSAVMIKKHGIKSVTNQELKDLNYRISLEQNFHKMVPKETGRIKKGRDIMEKMVWKAGEEQLQPYIGKYAGKGLATVLGPVIPGSAPIIEEIGKHTYYRGKHGMS